jgi:hypothetical protein
VRWSVLAGIVALAIAASACSAAAGGSAAPTEHPAMTDAGEPTGAAESMAPSAAASSSDPAATTAATPAALSSDPLHAIVLTDVRTGEQVSIGELAATKPLLLETMAIWCSNCRAQQHNVVAAHNEADFHSISLDVDPSENPDDLAAYSEQQGFDWHFAVADAELLGQLRERFGTAVAVPPGMPKILFRTDGSIEMIGLGQLYTAQQIADAVSG